MFLKPYDPSLIFRDTLLEIDLDVLKRNLRAIKNLIGPGVAVTGVVKANAYGLGAAPVSDALMEEGLRYLGVANLLEALALKDHNPKAAILVMGHTPDPYLRTGALREITLTLFSVQQARLLHKIGGELGLKPRVHLKVNTGFNRLGFKPDEVSRREIHQILGLSNLKVEGIFSHLALTSPEDDAVQLKRFTRFIQDLETDFDLVHIADSIAGIDSPDFRLDMIRPGAALYGLKSYHSDAVDLSPVARFVSRISQINVLDSGEGVSYDFTFRARGRRRIATLPVGYGDGYPRNLSNRGHVLIRGLKAPIVGIICMDQLMVDITAIDGAKTGDEAVLFGENLPVAEVAALAGTNKNEILARISSRVPRVYYEGGKPSQVLNQIL
ncbi:MAG: hypothetical protein AVO33_06830 [delta proteobacterium ML8_F1]|nr:MAG: hypothetical protein AVO33_06830 [delta proteobacterium ML8_F1]